jgi:DNA-directed RNA polymerase subunit H (RpoH/RPB5)
MIDLHFIAKSRGFDEIEWIQQDKYALLGNEVFVIIVETISRSIIKQEIKQEEASDYLFVVKELVSTNTARQLSNKTVSIVSIFDQDIVALAPPHRLVNHIQAHSGMPTISIYEPAIRIYNAKVGQVFEITRTQQEKFYRVAVE